MNDKIVFIYGSSKKEAGIEEGKMEAVGKVYEDMLHVSCLVQFAQEKYPEVNVFKQFNRKYTPEVVAFFYTCLFNHIVFLNTTSYDKNGEILHGKRGCFLFPNVISENAKKTLYEFCNNVIPDYSVRILYDLDIVDGLFDGKEISSINLEEPSKLLDRFFEKKNDKSKIL